MPSPEQILSDLRRIANEAEGVAIAWHLLAAVALAALALGWRPSRRLVGLLLAAPLLSVAAVAWVHGNPFNGTLFSCIAVLSIVSAHRMPAEPPPPGPPWSRVVGGLLIAFGLTYPHFLDDGGLAYLYAAPVGVVPCPTLSLVTGCTLLAGGLGSRLWCSSLAGLGLFYGLLGTLRLEVHLDLALLLGALALIALELRVSRASRGSSPQRE